MAFEKEERELSFKGKCHRFSPWLFEKKQSLSFEEKP